jgi:phosphatidylglycerophosphate synthase
MVLQEKEHSNPGPATFWTIPNILSLYRLIIFPFILYLIIRHNESLFSVFITVSLITDILDGLIARVFHLETKIGAKLDSWADTGTYILAFLAVYFFKWNEFSEHYYPLLLFLLVMIASYVLVFAKFKGLIGLHTYLFKITGYLQGGFIVILFTSGFYTWFYYVAVSFGILACIEEIIIILMISQPRTNVKGLYWVIKNGNK